MISIARLGRPVLATLAGALALIGSPIGANAQSTGQLRLSPSEYDFSLAGSGGVGTAQLPGIQTLVLRGDPSREGLYTLLLRVPPNTTIAAHDHPDERVATVISGEWRIGYGETFDPDQLKTLPPGSFYTEPAGDPHFAQTRDTEVILQITGVGPTGTDYVAPAPQ